MRKNVVNAYEFFVANMGKPVTPQELIAGADLGTGGSGPGPIVWNLKGIGVNIETAKEGKTVVSYTLPTPEGGKKAFVEPTAITEHYAKVAAPKAAAKKTKKTKTEEVPPTVETIPATAVPEVAAVEVVADEAKVEDDKLAARKARKANLDKIRRAAKKAAKELAAAQAEQETMLPDMGVEVTGLEDFPEFLKRETVMAE